jgi:RNA polymerase sigma-70 factor (ECF subfamily)
MDSVSTATVAVASDSALAATIKKLQSEGQREAARSLFDDLVALHQRRASRIAYQYLRDRADVDEAVQDAFVRAFTHLSSFKEELSFEVWFTRILVNGCLDRLKARRRRGRWLVGWLDSPDSGERVEQLRSTSRTPEELLLSRERRDQLARALDRLPDRQREVFVLSQVDGCSPREVSAITGLRESTVRVHLFRAIRKLRRLLAGTAA